MAPFDNRKREQHPADVFQGRIPVVGGVFNGEEFRNSSDVGGGQSRPRT
jgi:hypothetical protein